MSAYYKAAISPSFPFSLLPIIGGYGDWSSDGCNTSDSDSQVTCNCDHLTNFAILLVQKFHFIFSIIFNIQDASPAAGPTDRTELTLFLDSVSYIGIIVSIFCLAITVISYLLSK